MPLRRAKRHAWVSFGQPRPCRVRRARRRLTAVRREEDADLLLGYDANGGYGHRDHVKVYEVGRRAMEMAGVPESAAAPCTTHTARQL